MKRWPPAAFLLLAGFGALGLSCGSGSRAPSLPHQVARDSGSSASPSAAPAEAPDAVTVSAEAAAPTPPPGCPPCPSTPARSSQPLCAGDPRAAPPLPRGFRKQLDLRIPAGEACRPRSMDDDYGDWSDCLDEADEALDTLQERIHCRLARLLMQFDLDQAGAGPVDETLADMYATELTAWQTYAAARCAFVNGPHPGAGMGWGLSYESCIQEMRRERLQMLLSDVQSMEGWVEAR